MIEKLVAEVDKDNQQQLKLLQKGLKYMFIIRRTCSDFTKAGGRTLSKRNYELINIGLNSLKQQLII